MTIEELKLAIPQAINMLDQLSTSCTDLRGFIETTASIVDDNNPMSATVTEEQITAICQIIQARKQVIDGVYSSLDVSNFV
jgi:aspartate/methionine/tyrosine aminotransferase